MNTSFVHNDTDFPQIFSIYLLASIFQAVSSYTNIKYPWNIKSKLLYILFFIYEIVIKLLENFCDMTAYLFIFYIIYKYTDTYIFYVYIYIQIYYINIYIIKVLHCSAIGGYKFEPLSY